MGFELKAVIGQDAALREWKRIFPSLVLCGTSGDLRLMPLTFKLEVEMGAWLAKCGIPLRIGSTEGQVAQTWLQVASTHAQLLYVDAFEFGDRGHEKYTIWADGKPTETTDSLREYFRYFREQAGIDPGPGFDIEKYRGDTAAEKWAAYEAVADPRLPKASDFPPGTAFVINEFDVPLVSVPNTDNKTVSWFSWYGGKPVAYDPSYLKQGNSWDADSFEKWLEIVEDSLQMTSSVELQAYSNAGDERRVWKLLGYDAFEKEYYTLDGKFDTEAGAIAAARSRLTELELEQPSVSSGGQDGIQDWVFVIRPDGTRFRVRA